MIVVVHGVYHFVRNRVAFRNDYCLTCEAPRRSASIRSFDVLHIYGIPILPLGFWKRWRCETCGSDPHSNRKTRRPFKWAGFAVLCVFTLAFWINPIESDFVVGAWIIRVLAPLGAAATLVYLLTTPADPSLRQKLASVEATNELTCPYCDTPLRIGSRYSCPHCGVRRA